jgi:hypothetical protein
MSVFLGLDRSCYIADITPYLPSLFLKLDLDNLLKHVRINFK